MVLTLCFVIWIPVMLGFLFACVHRMGPEVKRRSGKGFGRQIGELLWLMATTFVPAPWYYILELYEDEKRARALDYLYPFETKRGVYSLMATVLTSHETRSALINKAEFARLCEDRRLPVIPVIGTAENGCYRPLTSQQSGLPRVDLFVKPMQGGGGRGAERWIHRADAWRGPSERVLDSSQLIEEFGERSLKRPWIVRPWVANHSDLEDLNCGALSTVRVLTCLDETCRPEITHASFKMARDPHAHVDNAHAGGIAASVDLRTGELGHSTDLGLARDSGWWSSHPTTGAPIVGRKLPDWDQVVQLALDAHDVLSDQIIVGWDIALLAAGPALVEGNKNPGVDLMQRLYQEPFGTSRVGELLAFHLRRAVATRDGRPAHCESVHQRSER
jgi:hypothetical protein